MNIKKTIMSIVITITAVAIIFSVYLFYIMRCENWTEGTVSYNMYYVNSAESCLGIEKKDCKFS